MVSVSFCSVHIDCTDVYKPSLNYNDGPHVLYLCGVFWFYVLLFYVMCCFSIVNDGWIMMSEWVSERVSEWVVCWYDAVVDQQFDKSPRSADWGTVCTQRCASLYVCLSVSLCVLCISLCLSLPLWYCTVRLLTWHWQVYPYTQYPGVLK